MKPTVLGPVLLAAVMALGSAPAAAQTTGQPLPGEAGDCTSQKAWTIDRVGRDYLKLVGQAEIDCGDMKFYADESIELFTDIKRVIAVGNVVFTQGGSRISGDRADFNYGTRTGVFYNASGISTRGEPSFQDPPDPAVLEESPPQPRETEVYFYGETVEKTGPENYRITKGGFTTCVQPTPRWELTSGSISLDLEHHAILTNTVFKVKAVPLLYMPVFYYPVNKEDRSTGFLIPLYGSSTIKGQTLSNAFFWAINRSHDATFLHDWFAKTGQGLGAEYRYRTGPSSFGNLRAYNLREHESTYVNDTGKTVTNPERRSYDVRGEATQNLGGGFQARGRADYFSDITVQQTYNTNIYEASRRQRFYSGALTGNWNEWGMTGAYERRETFFGTTNSTLTGTTPKISGRRSERPLFGSPVYFGIAGEYARLVRENKSSTRLTDQGLDRIDITPVIRFPFTTLTFLTINSSLSMHNTYWTESKVGNVQVPVAIWRRYLEMESEIVGPVFNRIWDTPNNGYMERFKHAIEPFVNLERTTAIDNADQIVQLDSLDSVIGETTRITYGVNNRFYAKRRTGPLGDRTPEIISVALRQTFYTDARAAQYDENYRTSFTGVPPSRLSPVSLLVRAQTSDSTHATLRAEYDTQFSALRTIGADGHYGVGGWFDLAAGWSQRRLIPGLKGFDDPSRLEHYLSSTTQLRTRGNRVGGIYGFNYDIMRRSYLQYRVVGYYNAQCCGFAVEYQYFDLRRLGSRTPVPVDRRLNFSFTLAGIGSFSNSFGAMSGAPSR
jgi:LPS-assembly protein